MSERITDDPTLAALEMAPKHRRSAAGVIHHGGQGCRGRFKPRRANLTGVCMSFIERFSAVLTPALLTSGCEPSGPAVVADAVYFGGPIVTLNDAQPAAEALALKDGKILDVGTRAEVEAAHSGKTTRTIDLAGRSLLTGFIDGHAHAQQFGGQAVGANLLAPPDGNVNTIVVLETTKEGKTVYKREP